MKNVFFYILTHSSEVADGIISKFSNKKVSIIDKLDTTKKGHMNGYLATLDSAFCIKEVR